MFGSFVEKIVGKRQKLKLRLRNILIGFLCDKKFLICELYDYIFAEKNILKRHITSEGRIQAQFL
jgi:hypothetical protein